MFTLAHLMILLQQVDVWGRKMTMCKRARGIVLRVRTKNNYKTAEQAKSTRGQGVLWAVNLVEDGLQLGRAPPGTDGGDNWE